MDYPVTQELAHVRQVVRGLVDKWLGAGKLRRLDLSSTHAVAERGLIGISWSKRYGGGGRSVLSRPVVTEELIRAGGVAKAKYLPGIATGQISFCLGLSETEAGSDLASVRTRAISDDGAWSITGRKIWTSHAHHAIHGYVLARTSIDGGNLRREHHLHEVAFDAARVEDDHVLGEVAAVGSR